MNTKNLSICFYLVSNITFSLFTNGAKILGVFPLQSKSHSLFTNAIMNSLLSAGHEIVILSPFVRENTHENLTIINSAIYLSNYSLPSDIEDLIKMSAFERLQFINQLEKDHCYDFMKINELQGINKSSRKLFDVMFVEVLTMYKCFLPLAQQLNIPVIGVVTQQCWLYADFAINNPNNPSFIPVTMRTYWKNDTFIERLVNTLFYAMKIILQVNYFEPVLNKFYKEHEQNFSGFSSDGDFPSPSLIFLNSYSAVLPRPMNPNIIEIGGIHMEEEKQLPVNIQKFIDESENGVILFSFGSVAKVSTINEHTLSILKQAFTEIPQRVIWKYEGKIENLPKNVMVRDWIPQRDILAHKKVLAFISHCGLSSVYESIYTGTPLIAVPLFSDQSSNAAILVRLGVAVYLDIQSFTKEDVLNAIHAIVNKSKYKEKMEQLSTSFKDRPMTAQKSVIYWTEYIMKHDVALQMQPTKLNWFQNMLLDVLLFLIFVLLVLCYIVYKLIKTIC